MPAIIRVKRRIDEEPLNAFVLNGKKRRLDGLADQETPLPTIDKEAVSKKGEISTVLKFAGTLKEQDDKATTEFAKRLGNKVAAVSLIQSKNSPKVTNAKERARLERKQRLHENRFRVVNCLRTTYAPEDADTSTESADVTATSSSKQKAITILDIEKQKKDALGAAASRMNENDSKAMAEQLIEESDAGYVYDLYLPENDQQADFVDLMDDNYISVRAFDDLFYDERYNNETDDDDADSEDSNREDYFTNDYPDEDEGSQYSDEGEDEADEDRELRRAIRNFIIDDDDSFRETSSSEEDDFNTFEDPYVQSIDTKESGFVDDVDTTFQNDVNCYGKAYAQYKRRILKQQKNKTGDLSSDADNDDRI